MTNPKWIFFDLGWVLVDETEAHRARLAETSALLAPVGLHLSTDQLMARCEQAATDFERSPFLGMLTRLGLSAAHMARVKNSVRYAKEYERLYPGAREKLAFLSERFKLGVIANQSEGTERRLSQWDIKRYFTVIFASAERGLAKPDPRVFAEVLSDAGCHPHEALMVGDRLDNDIGPAKAQGWSTARVLRGFHRFQRPRYPHEVPDITVSAVEELSAGQSGRIPDCHSEFR